MSYRRGCAIALGCLGITVVGSLLGGTIASHLALVSYNGGPMPLPPTADLWIEDSDDASGRAAATQLVQGIETHCAPSANGLRVGFDLLWYNAVTSGYEERVWLKSSRGLELGVYLWGDRALLRQMKSPYREQVVACDVGAVSLAKPAQGL